MMCSKHRVPLAPITPPAPAYAPAIARLLTLVHALSDVGVAILRRIEGAAIATPHAGTDVVGLNRTIRAILWNTALGAIIAGQWRITRRTPPSTPATAPSHPRPTTPQPRRARPPLRARRPPRVIPAAFSRLSIAQIAERICRDLHLTEASPLWPAGLLAIQQTPAEWSTTQFPRPLPRRRPKPSASIAASAPSQAPIRERQPERPIPAPRPPPTPGITQWRPPPKPTSLRSQLLQTTHTQSALQKALATRRP